MMLSLRGGGRRRGGFPPRGGKSSEGPAGRRRLGSPRSLLRYFKLLPLSLLPSSAKIAFLKTPRLK